MAVGYVGPFAQQEDQDNAAAAWTLATTASTSAGSCLVVAFYNEDSLAVGVPTDTKGNTYLKAFDLAVSGSLHGSLFYAPNAAAITGGVDTLGFTKNAAGNRPTAAAGIELTAIATASPLDVFQVANGTGTTQTTGTTAATSVADSMAVAIWINDSLLNWTGATNSFSAFDVNFGTLAGAGGGGRLAIGHKALSATGTVESTATRAAGAGVTVVGGVAVFKGSGGGGGGVTVKQLAALGVG